MNITTFSTRMDELARRSARERAAEERRRARKAAAIEYAVAAVAGIILSLFCC